MNTAGAERVRAAPERSRARIEGFASELGLSIPPLQVQQLTEYVALLARWNATYNLTAVRDPDQMLGQHIADCLSVVAPLRRQLATVDNPALLDVGSGAGLPGFVVAVMEPGWRIRLVDSVGKKTAFCRQVVAALKLDHVEAVHARVETLADANRFDVILSRAYSSLPKFVSSTRHLLRRDGVWMAMKGRLPTQEIAELLPDTPVFHVEQLHPPEIDGDRHLVWINSNTQVRTNSSVSE